MTYANGLFLKVFVMSAILQLISVLSYPAHTIKSSIDTCILVQIYKGFLN